ncbi:uncharacterized protein LOC119888955 [Micropterus salmoides]|uniref:uncharacterized protein LOC119888955 n=1 Tax=Micropterus salmoides TaxID=27706 RepID=UPI0018EDA43D|nr:uncharacterized protein LOC119888955 [Micropterus salmoides]
MISSVFTMRAILVLTLFMFILLIPASSGVNQTQNSLTTSLPNNMTASAEAQDNKHSTSDRTTMTSASPPSSSKVPSHSAITTTNQLSTTIANLASKSSNSNKLLIFVILLAILVLVLFMGCLYNMKDQHSGQDRSVPRLLLSVRERLRAGIGNLEDRIGLRLWPGWKRGEEEDEEIEGIQGEGAQRRDNGEKEEKGEYSDEDSEEDSDSSDDYSSMEGDNLRERALSRKEEEERQQNANEEGEETSSASEGGQNAVVGESNGDKKGSSEEMALVGSLKEDVKKELQQAAVPELLYAPESLAPSSLLSGFQLSVASISAVLLLVSGPALQLLVTSLASCSPSGGPPSSSPPRGFCDGFGFGDFAVSW